MSSNPGRTGRPENDVDPDSLGGRIRAARKKAGYKSAQSFAADIPVERPTVNRWESNKIIPPPAMLVRINDLLGTNFTKADLDRAAEEKERREAKAKSAGAIGLDAKNPPKVRVNLLLDAHVTESLDKASVELKGAIRREQIAASFVNRVVKEMVDEWLANRHRRVRSIRVQTADQIIHDACAAAKEEANGDE